MLLSWLSRLSAALVPQRLAAFAMAAWLALCHALSPAGQAAAVTLLAAPQSAVAAEPRYLCMQLRKAWLALWHFAVLPQVLQHLQRGCGELAQVLRLSGAAAGAGAAAR